MREVANLRNYVKSIENHPCANKVVAKKIGYIIAHPAKEDEIVVTWSQDARGRAIIEKEAIAKSGDWLATKATDRGQPIIDINGNTNDWLILDEKFDENYEPTNIDHVYRPKGKPQTFIRLPEGIQFEQWDATVFVDIGGYINVTDPDDYYAISARDFADTYRIVN